MRPVRGSSHCAASARCFTRKPPQPECSAPEPPEPTRVHCPQACHAPIEDLVTLPFEGRVGRNAAGEGFFPLRGPRSMLYAKAAPPECSAHEPPEPTRVHCPQACHAPIEDLVTLPFEGRVGRNAAGEGFFPLRRPRSMLYAKAAPPECTAPKPSLKLLAAVLKLSPPVGFDNWPFKRHNSPTGISSPPIATLRLPSTEPTTPSPKSLSPERIAAEVPEPSQDNSPHHSQPHLSLFAATSVGVGAIVGGGILALAGVAFSVTGPSAILAFCANGVIAVLTAPSFAEMASKFSQSGGTYNYAKKVLSVDAAFMVGWVVWFASIVAAVLYALGFAHFALVMLQDLFQLVGWPLPDLLLHSFAKAIVAGANDGFHYHQSGSQRRWRRSVDQCLQGRCIWHLNSRWPVGPDPG